MKRRALGGVAAGAAFWPILANAQPEQRVYRVGMLRPTPLFDNSLITTALRQLGYVMGTT